MTAVCRDSSRFNDYGRETTTPVPGETLNDGWLQRWYKLRLNRVLERVRDVTFTQQFQHF